MWHRKLTLTAILVVGFGFAKQAVAGPFDTPPRGYAHSINRSLDQAGFNLRLRPEGCRNGVWEECRFSTPAAVVVVEGRAKPARTRSITISSDLLRDDVGVAPADLVADAAAVLAATMAVFDPELTPERRDQLLSNLTEAALTKGHSEGDGNHARYALAFDQGADGLLVITVTPRP